MSRIDEALRRAGDTRRRPANDLTLDQYPDEGPAAAERPDAHSAPFPRGQGVEPVGQRPSFDRTGIDSNDKLVVGPARPAASLEQYRKLAAALHAAQDEHGIKKVLVTSAVPREGKTLTAVNLALTLSESYGRHVLLIDGDLRRPSIHEVLGVSNQSGLTDVLQADRRDPPLVHVSQRLAVLPAGPLDVNPQAGLSSVQMRTLLDEAAEQFDWVLIDSPPMALVSDAQLLSRLTQAVVLVIAAGSTPFQMVERAIVEIGRERIIGTVLNRVAGPAMSARYYDYRTS